MFNYFLKGVSKCQDRADVVHLSRKLIQNMHLLDTQEISLCLNKLSKVNFEDKTFWNNICRIITTTDVRVVGKFKCLRGRKGGDRVTEGVGMTESASNGVRERCVSNPSDGGYDATTPEQRRDTVPQKGDLLNRTALRPNERSVESSRPNDGTDRKDKLLYHFNMEELCLVLNALAKVNVRNEEILKLALQKIITEFEMSRHVVNMIKAVGSFGVGNPGSSDGGSSGGGSSDGGSSDGGSCDSMEQALRNVYQNYDSMSRNLTERDISVLIRVMLTWGNQTGGIQTGGIQTKGGEANVKQTSGIPPSKTPHEEEVTHLGSNNVGMNNVNGNHVGDNPVGDNHVGGNHVGGNHVGGNHAGGNHVGGNHASGNHVGGNHVGVNTASGNHVGGNTTANALIEKLINSVKKINHISEQSIALILNACTKSCVKNKALLDMLKIVIILKLKQDKNKCSDIFVSSITHSYSSFAYRDRVLYDTIAEYVCANMDSINVKALVIILTSFVNIEIVNLKLFNAAIAKLSRREVIKGLSNQCTSNIVTIITKSYNYLCTEKMCFILEVVKGRLRREFSRTGIGATKPTRDKQKGGATLKDAPQSDTPLSLKQSRHSAFLDGFLMKHLTNILNNLSKINHADANLFALFSHLILKKKKEINKLDFMNITSAYARFGYVDEEIYKLIQHHAKKYLEDKNLKYMEFINMFTSIATFSLIERNRRIDHRMGDRWKGDRNGHFAETIHVMMGMLRGETHSRCVLGEHEGHPPDEDANTSKNSIGNGNHTGDVPTHSPPLHHALIHDRKNIIDNLSAKHTCCILATMSKLDTHDRQIYEQCVKNLKKKILKMDSRSLSMYLLYVSKFGLIPDRYIKTLISNSFKTVHLRMGKINVDDAKGYPKDHLNKIFTLCTQLQTEDIVNAVYIVRSLIKNDPSYRDNVYVMCAYLEGIYAGLEGRNGSVVKSRTPSGMQSKTPRKSPSRREPDKNIVHIGDGQAEDPGVSSLLSGRKLNTQTACILMNTLAFINTHLHLPSVRYAKIVTYLLLFSLRFMIDRLNLRQPLQELLYEDTSQSESMNRNESRNQGVHRNGNQNCSDIKGVVTRKIDSASIRQINTTILMIFHLGSLNPFSYSPQWEVTNLASYPLRLLQYVYFFLKFSPLAPFERYTSVYNSVGNRRKLTNYCGGGYAHAHPTGLSSDVPTGSSTVSSTGLSTDLSTGLSSEPPRGGSLPSISEGEISIYQTVGSLLKRKGCDANCTLLSSFGVYMYSVDMLILRGGKGSW
ncbi:conserved Plasmodium protein, unknown function [Plasmodium knowlesi strain H]|uniref:Uncharacterized protein n=3 Tax=Plasmodium knowlesi TaxID=5850 RepID=A0A5K1TYN3_PLAKH|nr:heptatricopeptide repeat-containing protein, putative [Plasmodium knowlesi strain H]OTN64524.1 Uncharacterized protein PKNOH_S130208500 [Plasmodium knowlesi]CAA9989246.1 heptatricopeptide repeat-containing protein, putative [Plasmodium knowlesi strain H]SBO26189.1 conserved Plasmodium protein, unknown function [Plasmodium knowlesi strain H]SBO27040.1 conserved Plasmodium protein, unknown function [Plasmodium knowlesi strain H]VVS78720.1 heptatricopeptide repeat-containing protein, putative |eukprot:XP_002261592.1 hypothetical protein, conserved in Plasmodium species [Plasmodium knowlesi strain H]